MKSAHYYMGVNNTNIGVLTDCRIVVLGIIEAEISDVQSVASIV